MRESTVHLSLNRKNTILGVDSRVFGIEAGLLAIFISLQLWSFLLLLPFIHFLAKWAQARDERLFEAAMRYTREANTWDPWHHHALTKKRPEGFGRGLPL